MENNNKQETNRTENNRAKGKRLAKNTLVLYVRMFILMAVNLYTSRVILEALGVEDFGVYNVVGGFVAMFAVLSKSLSAACSRYLNVEMGRGTKESLNRVFSMAVTIQSMMAILIAVLCGIVGTWYVNTYMVIPEGRLTAANWVMAFSIITFCSNLITVPYNASIIAHEKMKTFAYVSLFEAFGKLAISFAVMVSPIDTLIFYAAMICALQFTIRAMYRIYCRRHFEECKYRFFYDKALMKEMFGFAGWNMIGSSSAVLRNQGNNMVLNLFFGPVVNAARGVANQVLHAVDGFVHNFIMAMRPQITQSYAAGNYSYLMTLLFQGARLSFYMLLFLSLPILMETDYLLHLWLKNVPDHSVLFVQLTLIFAMIESLSNPLITAQLATGNIRNYQLTVGGIQLLNVPISYVCLKMGMIPETVLIIAIVLSFVCLGVRICMLRGMINLDAGAFIRKVVLNVAMVSVLSVPVPLAVRYLMPAGTFLTFVTVSAVTLLSSGLVIYFIGSNREERELIHKGIRKILKKGKRVRSKEIGSRK